MDEINSLWDLNPARLQPPEQYEQTLELNPAYDLGGYLPGPVKRVVINDYLPDGTLYVTPNEIILSKRGWEAVVRLIQIRNECNVAVRRIVERQMGDVLAWLREAGHDV
jgi:hypothetical protein